MGKETVRYPDALVARIEDLVADSDVFESKSELHRFASDFFLCVLDPDHDPTVLGYDDILADLEAEHDVALESEEVATSDGAVPFLESYLRVRRSLLHGDIEEARAYVTETYDITDREALLLDELIGKHRDQSADTRPISRATRPPSGRAQASTPTEASQPATESEPDETDVYVPDAEESEGDRRSAETR